MTAYMIVRMNVTDMEQYREYTKLTPDIIAKLGHRPDVEVMMYVDGAVLANVTRMNQSKYSLLRVIGTPLYKQMTVRNITTAKKTCRACKLDELCADKMSNCVGNCHCANTPNNNTESCT